MDGYTQAEHDRAMDRLWADVQAHDPDGADAAQVPTYAELADQLRRVAEFSFSPIEAKEGYPAALKAFCTLKRETRRLLARIGGAA